MTFLRSYRVEIAVAALALIAHLICFLLVIQASGSVLDAVRADDGFYELAENVRAGNGFSWSDAAPYAPNPLRTPGYPYVLAGLIAVFGVLGAALIQLAAASALPVLGMRLAEMITRSRPVAIATGIVLALDPTLALLSFQFYTETLFLLLFFAWVIVSLRYMEKPGPHALVAGAVLLGCAILVRSSAQYLPLVFAAFVLWRFRGDWRRGITHAVIYLAVVGAILAPWIARNMALFGSAGLSAQTPFVLYTNFAPAVLSVANGTDFAETVEAFLTDDEFLGNAITLENGSEYAARALGIMGAHPAASALIAGKSLFTFFTNDGFYALIARIGLEPGEHMPLLVVARLVWIAITLAAFAGAFLCLWKERSPRAVFLVLLVAYFALTSTIAAFGTNPRYRLPVDPVLLAFAGLGAAFLLARGRRLLHSKHP